MKWAIRKRRTSPAELDVLIPTRNRPVELATTLAGLAAQETDFAVTVSDQSDEPAGLDHPAVTSLLRVLQHQGHPVRTGRHLPRRGLAEHRSHLLGMSGARYVLFLDDDVWLEPDTLTRLLAAIRALRCGFVGNAPHGLSYLRDERPAAWRHFTVWPGRPLPERLVPYGPQWSRARVHDAANLLHLTRRLRLGPKRWLAYKVAWLGACVLYDRAKLLAVGGYDFWPDVPAEHAGEDVLVQLRLMAAYGGAGIVPSGAFHLETPTTVPDRQVECYNVVPPFGHLTDASGDPT
jgi:GT2 family glycosyltransferase